MVSDYVTWKDIRNIMNHYRGSYVGMMQEKKHGCPYIRARKFFTKNNFNASHTHNMYIMSNPASLDPCAYNTNAMQGVEKGNAFLPVLGAYRRGFSWLN